MPDPIELKREISPNDQMFLDNHDVKHYFWAGSSGLNCILRALAARGDDAGEPARILDFPCGHGRVLRHIRAAFPRSEITACDLLRDGVDFCAAHFGAIPVYSDVDTSRIPLPRDHFDLIWVGSLLTHLDAPRWTEFLTFFRSLLTPGGVVVFSTHGRQAHEWIVSRRNTHGLDDPRSIQISGQFISTGFGYLDYADSREYGISLSDPAWVSQLLMSISEFRLVSFGEKLWSDHHDVYACVRDPGWKVHLTAAPEFPPHSQDSGPSGSRGKPLYKRIFGWRRSA
jgi:SAM-dependent methyltransferase